LYVPFLLPDKFGERLHHLAFKSIPHIAGLIMMVGFCVTGARASDPIWTPFVLWNAYAAYTESIKGIFSVLGSEYPAFDTKPAVYAEVVTPALQHVLRREGYRTALFHSGRFMYLGMVSILENRGYDLMEDA
jgi:hypothetical protein